MWLAVWAAEVLVTLVRGDLISAVTLQQRKLFKSVYYFRGRDFLYRKV
jgi:hypothetical protein